jgi:hypothetical protein
MSQRLPPHVTVALVTLALTGAAVAAEVSAACKPVIDGTEKTLLSDHSTLTVDGAESTRSVTLGGQAWYQEGKHWRKSLLTPLQFVRAFRDDIKAAREFTCKLLPDSEIDATPVAVIGTHVVSGNGDFVDSRVAIVKSSGLLMSVVNLPDEKGTVGREKHYAYDNIQGPK